MKEKQNTIFHPRVLASESYINNDNQHQRNEKAYVNQGPDFIAKLVFNGGKEEKRNKFVQFVAIFHL
jgi:hypothetical protein